MTGTHAPAVVPGTADGAGPVLSILVVEPLSRPFRDDSPA